MENEYFKDFDGWNEVKKQVDFSENKPIFYEREIWHCKIGINVGYEQNGVGLDFVRPVLVFKKFNQRVFWAIPLTKTIKNLPFYFTFMANNASDSSTAILSQIRLIDSKRLLNKVSDISLINFETLKEKFKALLP
jgi:mRNA interferase MazF